MNQAPLAERFEQAWRRHGWTEPGDRVVVACSGGLDSVVLLHLLRFFPPVPGVRVRAAHFDHGMRSGSDADADWVTGLCGSWGVPLTRERAARVPRNATAARKLRYEFLDAVAEQEDGRILTAHHADDQVETVVYRLMRGTGIRGLAGIPARRRPALVRPLLGFGRSELEDYATAEGISYRSDPTNRSLRYARNRIRHRVLPAMEAVHPGARRAILRLARNAERTNEVMDTLLAPILDRVTLERTDDSIVVDRAALLDLAPQVRAEVARRMTAELGLRLTEAGTASAVEFITDASSGARLSLPGPYVLSRDFGRLGLRMVRTGAVDGAKERDGTESTETPASVSIRAPESGSARIRLSERGILLSWGPFSDVGTGEAAARGPTTDDPLDWTWKTFAADRLTFPLTVRGWRPGDRTRTSGGRKKLKKLFREMRVERSVRHRIPIVVDASERVIWVPGTSVDPDVSHPSDGAVWRIGVRDAGPA